MENLEMREKRESLLKKGNSSVVMTIFKYFGTLVVLGMIVFCFIVSLAYMRDKEQVGCNYEVFEDTTRLAYYNTMYLLVNEVDGYIHRVAPRSELNGVKVVEGCLDHEIDICFVLAQGELESHFGTTGTARHTNSVWNVMAYDGLTHKNINEDGQYDHPDESMIAYLNLLKRRYLSNGRTEYDLMDKYVDKSGKRYASSEQYEARLVSKYKDILECTKIDSLSARLHHYELILGY